VGVEPRRIGEIMVEMSYICRDHLSIALEIQSERDEQKKKHILLGEIMVSDGFITRSQLRRILLEQERRWGN
jgi:hypothetical protein